MKRIIMTGLIAVILAAILITGCSQKSIEEKSEQASLVGFWQNNEMTLPEDWYVKVE